MNNTNTQTVTISGEEETLAFLKRIMAQAVLERTYTGDVGASFHDFFKPWAKSADVPEDRIEPLFRMLAPELTEIDGAPIEKHLTPSKRAMEALAAAKKASTQVSSPETAAPPTATAATH